MLRFVEFLCGKTSMRGATAIEYAMIAAFIVVAIVGVVALLGTDLAAAYQRVSDAFS